MAYGGMIFISFNLKKKMSFCVISFNFFKCYYCSINLRRQSEHSGICPDTISLVFFEKYLIVHKTGRGSTTVPKHNSAEKKSSTVLKMKTLFNSAKNLIYFQHNKCAKQK